MLFLVQTFPTVGGTFLCLPKFRHVSSSPHRVLTCNVSILRDRFLLGVWGQTTALPTSLQLGQSFFHVDDLILGLDGTTRRAGSSAMLLRVDWNSFLLWWAWRHSA